MHWVWKFEWTEINKSFISFSNIWNNLIWLLPSFDSLSDATIYKCSLISLLPPHDRVSYNLNTCTCTCIQFFKTNFSQYRSNHTTCMYVFESEIRCYKIKKTYDIHVSNDTNFTVYTHALWSPSNGLKGSKRNVSDNDKWMKWLHSRKTSEDHLSKNYAFLTDKLQRYFWQWQRAGEERILLRFKYEQAVHHYNTRIQQRALTQWQTFTAAAVKKNVWK